MKSPLRQLPARRKFDRGRQRKPIRPVLTRATSLRHAARQSNRMHARRTGFRGL